MLNSSCTLNAENTYRAVKYDEVANKLTAPNMFIDYCVTICRAASVSTSNAKL